MGPQRLVEWVSPGGIRLFRNSRGHLINGCVEKELTKWVIPPLTDSEPKGKNEDVDLRKVLFSIDLRFCLFAIPSAWRPSDRLAKDARNLPAFKRPVISDRG